MKFFFSILWCLFLVSCAGVQSRYHEVQSEESWDEIASRYHVPVDALKKYNGERLGKVPAPGEKLYIPFEESPTWEAPMSEDVGGDRAPSSVESQAHFSWPLTGYVSSGFGRRHGRDHEGIDIPAQRGTPVKASRSGHVIYAGNRIKGYGSLVIIRHADKYSTVYAHLSKIRVKRGQFVSRGQRIGDVGRTGRATSPHLHFEIRRLQTAVNPLLYLQAQYATNTLRNR